MPVPASGNPPAICCCLVPGRTVNMGMEEKDMKEYELTSLEWEVFGEMARLNGTETGMVCRICIHNPEGGKILRGDQKGH